MRAQTLLNRFLGVIVRGPQVCVDRSPSRVAEMRGLLFYLRRNNQLPLKEDGVFGPNTETPPGCTSPAAAWPATESWET